MLKIRSCSLPSTMHNFLVMFNYFIWLLFYSYSSLYSWFVFSCWMTHFLASSYWLHGSSSHDSWMTFFHVKYVNDVSFMPVVLILFLHYTHGSYFDLPRLKMTVLYYHLSIWMIFHSFLVIIRADLYVWLYFLEYYFMCVIYDVFMHFSMRPHLYAYFTSSINK